MKATKSAKKKDEGDGSEDKEPVTLEEVKIASIEESLQKNTTETKPSTMRAIQRNRRGPMARLGIHTNRTNFDSSSNNNTNAISSNGRAGSHKANDHYRIHVRPSLYLPTEMPSLSVDVTNNSGDYEYDASVTSLHHRNALIRGGCYDDRQNLNTLQSAIQECDVDNSRSIHSISSISNGITLSSYFANSNKKSAHSKRYNYKNRTNFKKQHYEYQQANDASDFREGMGPVGDNYYDLSDNFSTSDSLFSVGRENIILRQLYNLCSCVQSKGSLHDKKVSVRRAFVAICNAKVVIGVILIFLCLFSIDKNGIGLSAGNGIVNEQIKMKSSKQEASRAEINRHGVAKIEEDEEQEFADLVERLRGSLKENDKPIFDLNSITDDMLFENSLSFRLPSVKEKKSSHVSGTNSLVDRSDEESRKSEKTKASDVITTLLEIREDDDFFGQSDTMVNLNQTQTGKDSFAITDTNDVTNELLGAPMLNESINRLGNNTITPQTVANYASDPHIKSKQAFP